MGHDPLIPEHGGYRKLKSFQIARLVYDVTVRFCSRYVEKHSRTRDQMVQAARSGVQNIAEGSQASGTSKKIELKLTNIARASLEELMLDYEDFLRHNRFPIWERSDPRRQDLIDQRCENVDAVADWIQAVRGRNPQIKYAEISANAALALATVACTLLDRQLATLAKNFEEEGGFTERLYRHRKASRNMRNGPAEFPGPDAQ
jgi:four helix bundle suffix protein